MKQTWEESIDRIFSRAHIPEYANDAKYPILSLLAQARTEALGEIKREIEKSALPGLNKAIVYTILSRLSTPPKEKK